MIRRSDNEPNIQCSEHHRFAHDSLVRQGEEPPLASHLVTPRMLYTHHGIYVGNGRVIHYAGLAYGVRCGPVEEVSLERFGQGHGIRVRSDERCFDPVEVVERARSRLGERGYRILTNNCEHFCIWALRDDHRSCQVERLGTLPRTLFRLVRRLLPSGAGKKIDHLTPVAS